MKIVETRFLRGPNLHARRPVMEAVLDLQELDEVGSHQLPGFTERLLQMLPALHEHHCGVGYRGGFVDRLREGTYMGHITEHVMLELQARAGHDLRYGKTRMIPGRPRHYRLVMAYAVEALAERALTHAVQIVQAAAEGRTLDTAPLVEQLQRIRCSQGLGPSTQAVVDAAQERGIPVLRLTDDASLFQLGWGARQRRIQATITSASPHIAVSIASDKALTKRLLAEAGIPVPQGRVVKTLDEALEAAREVGLPVAVKPLDANQGKGVSTDLRRLQEVAVAFERARAHGGQVIVEQHVAGGDYRVLVVGGRLVAAAHRQPPQVVGDGVHSVRELVERLNADPRRGRDHEAPLTRVQLDALAADCLAAQGLGFDSVLPPGKAAVLRGNANLSTGGSACDVTGLVHPDTARACVRAARRVGLDVAGIDLVCRDIAQPLGAQGGAIVEVNAAPGLRMHEQPSEGAARAAGRAIVEGLFASGDDGRIPLIAVTGTNGKTTTALAIAHVLRAEGLRTGCTTTEGVYIDDQRVMDGDCTGYWSARAVLTDPDVDAAVLETARGGILKRGLCYDRSDVAVVLNISADHLGQDGIETLDQLAQVKAVVADTARRALVLNAEDVRCVAMAQQAREGVEVIFFALQPQHPVVLQHLAGGGRAVVLRDGEIVLAQRGGMRPVVRADRLPFTLGGRARHNVANALAAVAALLALQRPPQLVAQALSGFACSSHSNPLRFNVFQLGAVRLVVDYAHNLAAYQALVDTCRATGGGRLVGVVSAPGDRRDAELAEVGRFCAEAFDDLLVYELDEDRGRPPGDTARVLMLGARATGRPATERLTVREALREGLARCAPGDTLVYGCATHLDDIAQAFGDLAINEERSGPALRLAWSAEAPRAPVFDALEGGLAPEREAAGGLHRRALPRLPEPS
ncbi:MAG: cyanophycin synthetase [Pseudomonadota bacterium]